MNESSVISIVPFTDLAEKLRAHFDTMCQAPILLTTDVNGDELWDEYLRSFPPGTNSLYRERTEHDCQCCKHFIRRMGNVCAVIDDELVTLWDIHDLGYPYNEVARSMAALVRSRAINSAFLSEETRAGTECNHSRDDDGTVHEWRHFACDIPINHRGGASIIGRSNDIRRGIRRSLDEITAEAAETVLDLIANGSLYRGEEHRKNVADFLGAKRLFDTLMPDKQDLFAWGIAANSVAIRSTVIGTLLTDLSEGRDLEAAVASFETKVAPTNYKRPKPVVSKRMIDEAEKTITSMGLLDSLPRRHCTVDDLSINALLWADRSVKKRKGVFDAMRAETPTKIDSLSRVEEVPIDKFVRDILPQAASLTIIPERRHLPNLVSLLAPEHADAPALFSWGNNFSWTYKGGVADSIKERVKAAGGSVTGLMRASLSWYNTDDLDIHVTTPNGAHIYYENKNTRYGNLDVDMNVTPDTTTPVENVTWPTEASLQEGIYRISVNQYNLRNSANFGFEVELECGNQLFTFEHADMLKNKATIEVAKFRYARANGIEILSSLPHSNRQMTEWGITTETEVPVKMVLQSPNQWAAPHGNRHLFFVLEGCLNPEPVRGFFNEYLRDGLNDHRKVFEVLAGKMTAPYSNDQLSGIGFSSTQRNSILVRVSGHYNRTIKVNF